MKIRYVLCTRSIYASIFEYICKNVSVSKIDVRSFSLKIFPFGHSSPPSLALTFQSKFLPHQCDKAFIRRGNDSSGLRQLRTNCTFSIFQSGSCRKVKFELGSVQARRKLWTTYSMLCHSRSRDLAHFYAYSYPPFHTSF